MMLQEGLFQKIVCLKCCKFSRLHLILHFFTFTFLQYFITRYCVDLLSKSEDFSEGQDLVAQTPDITKVLESQVSVNYVCKRQQRHTSHARSNSETNTIWTYNPSATPICLLYTYFSSRKGSYEQWGSSCKDAVVESYMQWRLFSI